MNDKIQTQVDEQNFDQLFTPRPKPLDVLKLDNSSSMKTCVMPPVCEMNSCALCWNTLIINCVHCSKQAVFFLLCFFVVLSLIVLITNTMIVFVGVKHHQAGKASKMDYCRTSLAVADLISGKYAAI